MTDAARKLLAQGCEQLGLALNDAQQRQLNTYLDSLVKWNKAYNLTAIRDPQDMVVKHLLDSLAIHRAVNGSTILDVGTGPGLPGIPMAICRPDQHWTLLDSNGKKTRFLLQMKQELQLNHLNVIKDRIEAVPETQQFDCITCRAFSSLQDFVGHCLRLLKPTGYLLALKGQIPQDEIAALDGGALAITIEPMAVPFLHEERHLIYIRNKHAGSQIS
ncbi:MAG TPA: 16S rRNA (guanine(527)-N(7))-methyltransferase RsmG [Dongiaceae bacterium]|nr:16S rRNA (guanine(527)-N(7))-methyltransferase RsmG [Dongiaceae bacterium]